MLGSQFHILGLKDFPEVTAVEETGATFEENAILKAKGYFEQTKTPCIADDGGLMIAYLDGAPGVHSKRWVKANDLALTGNLASRAEHVQASKFPRVLPRGQNGREASDDELAAAVLEKMRGVPQEKRTARLGGLIVFWDGEHLLKQENWIEGYITERLMGDIKPGFPYRPLLMIPQFGKPYSDLTNEEHDQVNFRRKNLQILKPKILEILTLGVW